MSAETMKNRMESMKNGFLLCGGEHQRFDDHEPMVRLSSKAACSMNDEGTEKDESECRRPFEEVKEKGIRMFGRQLRREI